jgi:sugar phosphate isomerase/epimerase
MDNDGRSAFADDAGRVPPLVLSSYTLGTTITFEDRVRVAAATGFDGIGLRAENYWDAQRAGLDDDAMKSVAKEHGVEILEVEYITGWGTAEDRDTAQQEKEQAVFHMARSFGVRHLNTGLLEKLPRDVITGAFADLCDRAGDDLIVALEFMPYSGVPDLDTAWQILRDADRPNSALIIDVWHWTRAGMTPAALDHVPADKIVAIQLCDVQEIPMDPMRPESLAHRLPPGHGYGDPAGMLRALGDRGARPRVITVEVISEDLISRGADAAARTVADAARDVLVAATETPRG